MNKEEQELEQALQELAHGVVGRIGTRARIAEQYAVPDPYKGEALVYGKWTEEEA